MPATATLLTAALTSSIAVRGTLRGAQVTAESARRRDAHARAAQDHRAALTHAYARLDAAEQSVIDTVAALDGHRSAMRRREDLALNPDALDRELRLAAADAQAHAAREHLDRCLMGLRLRGRELEMPELHRVGTEAAEATYRMWRSPDPDELTLRQDAARAACHALTALAADLLTGWRTGLDRDAARPHDQHDEHHDPDRETAQVRAHRVRVRLDTAERLVGTLVIGLDAHLATMRADELERLAGHGDELRAADTTAATHATRRALAAPVTALRLVAAELDLPQLHTAAQTATQAAYALWHSPDADRLHLRDQAARQAVRELLALAARLLAHRRKTLDHEQAAAQAGREKEETR
ncbi:hypothetical protein GCM10010428_44640 [Actinosynnema pretiosum subsp. pretiosum]